MKAGVGGPIGVSSYAIYTKRRWRGFVIAVLGLVILSMLVPLVFLLGFHNGFHSSGFPSEPQSTESHDESHHIKDLVKILAPTLPKEPVRKQVPEMPVRTEVNLSRSKDPVLVPEATKGRAEEHDDHTRFFQKTKANVSSPVGVRKANISSPVGVRKANISMPVTVIQQAKVVDEHEISCELRFGSYCIWHHEHKEDMKDFVVKKLKDRLFVARAYFPSIAKLPTHEKLSRELKQNIQDFERILSEATADRDLPPQIEKKLENMEATIAKAKSVPVDCNNVDKKFRQLVDATEDEANFHTKQSAFLYQLAVQTLPKSLHCLSMRLTVEYFHSSSVDVKDSMTKEYTDQDLYHYVVISDNTLASSVVINSTVMHAKESKKLVFHVLTDKQNYYAMKLWFLRNAFKEATVQVLNIEDYQISSLSRPEELHVTYQVGQKLPKMQYMTEYISLFSHSHYHLPEIFKNLDKVVVLDDDILVQQDLSALWSINMGGKVNGAVELCAVRLGQLSNYLGRSNFNKNSCAWMSGLNILDLARWRELDLTGTFRKLVQELNSGAGLPEAAASSATLLTFQDQVYALDHKWVQSGLGHDYGLGIQEIRNSAVLHYNGNMKPWLELGIPKYRSLWVKFLNREDQCLSECNVIP